MSDVPRHLKIETYFLSEVQHLKNHILGMLELALPLGEQTRQYEDWEQILYTPQGQFDVLFGSLDQLRGEIGEQNFELLRSKALQLKAAHESNNWHEFADIVHEMDTIAWLPRRKVKAH